MPRYCPLKRFQNLPSGPISVLGRGFESSKYSMYSCDSKPHPALTLDPIVVDPPLLGGEGFETASTYCYFTRKTRRSNSMRFIEG
jgi:hypothetical protein